MEDKFLDGMVNTSISMMKRLSEGGTLTPDELKFILLTKQMSEKANKQNKSIQLQNEIICLMNLTEQASGRIEKKLNELLEIIKEDKSNEI